MLLYWPTKPLQCFTNILHGEKLDSGVLLNMICDVNISSTAVYSIQSMEDKTSDWPLCQHQTTSTVFYWWWWRKAERVSIATVSAGYISQEWKKAQPSLYKQVVLTRCSIHWQKLFPLKTTDTSCRENWGGSVGSDSCLLWTGQQVCT